MGDAGPAEAPVPPVCEETTVLVIGAGPAGLLTSHILNQHGVQSLILEKHNKRLTAPKAHAIGPRSFDILKQSGINIRKLRDAGTERDESRYVGLMTTLAGEELRIYPYERMDVDVLDSTPEMFHNISQPITESHIAENLEGAVEVRKGHAFVSCSNDEKGVTSVIEDRASGERYAIRSRYLAACDGAKSKVRDNLGIQCLDESSVEILMTVELTIDVRPIVKDKKRMLYNILNPNVTGVLIGYDLGSKMVLTTKINQEVMPVAKWTEAFCRQFVDKALGEKIPYTVDSFRPWILGRKVAQTYKRGNTFLVGDAAHSFPPSAGIGLNTGIGDAHNLALKIAAVEHGWADSSILETYDTERRPIAEINSQRSYINSKRIHGMYSKLGLTEEDPIKAKQLFNQAIHDPIRRRNMDEVMDELTVNFDNLELHIGFVYGDPVHPENPSEYRPKYVPGGRLPHLWIEPLNDELMKDVPATDLTHISEFSCDGRALRRYSTLDLCSPHGFTLIISEGEFQDKRARSIRDLISQTTKTQQPPSLRTIVLGRDFRIVFKDKAEDWLERFQLGEGQQGGVLIRPDQHILFILDTSTTAEEVATVLKTFVGDV